MEEARSLNTFFAQLPTRGILRTSPFGDSPKFAYTEFSEVRATLRCLFLLRTDHQHWAVGMAHNRVRDAAHQRSSHSAEPPTAHHDQARTYFLGNLYDLLGAIPLGYPEMLLGDLTSLLLDLRSLLVEYVLRLLPEMFDRCGVANIVGGITWRNRHHVQLRVGALSHIDGGGAGQLRLPRAVGGQQDRGREDAHLLASFSSAVRCISPHRAATIHSVIRSHQ